MIKTPGKKITKEGFVIRAREIHGNKYDYTSAVYCNYHTPLMIKCKTHGNFLQTPAKHISRGHGCPKCGGTSRLNTTEFIKKANVVHSNKYNYDKSSYVNNPTKIEIICNRHGSFFQRPNRHLRGDGCPKCNASKGEMLIRKHLEENELSYNEQVGFDACKNKRKLPFDFIVTYNGEMHIIEYYGEQHYEVVNFTKNAVKANWKFKKTQLHDKIKQNWCKKQNIPLCIIPYWKSQEVKEMITEFLGITPNITKS